MFTTYCTWSFLLFVYGIMKFTDGKFAELAEQSFEWFLTVYLAVAVVMILIGGALSWLAEAKAHKWASWGFILFCIWRAIDSLWGGIYFSIGLSGLDWIRSVIFPFGWLVLAVLEWRAKGRRLGDKKQIGASVN